MILEWKKCYLNVPLNETGIQDHEYDTDMSNIYTVTLDTKEYDLLSDVFHEWNQKFDIINDIFEDWFVKQFDKFKEDCIAKAKIR